MCVIIVKPAGVEMPPKQVLTAAYKSNPHGCGFCTKRNIFKTLDFDEFMNEIENVSTKEACIIHFRLATHGSICTTNCHPFKRGNVFFAHNGILNISPIGDMTDSETAFQQILYPAIRKFGYGTCGMDDAVNDIIGYSKFAFLKGRTLKLYGDFIKHKGCYYSNLRFSHNCPHYFERYNRQQRDAYNIFMAR